MNMPLTGGDHSYAPATFTLNATATDADGIDSLRILQDGQVLSATTSSVLSLRIENPAPGAYVYVVWAKDKHATDPKVATRELVVIVRPAIPNAIAAPLHDLNGSSARVVFNAGD